MPIAGGQERAGGIGTVRGQRTARKGAAQALRGRMGGQILLHGHQKMEVFRESR